MGTCIGESPRLAQPKRLCTAENSCGAAGNYCCLDCPQLKRKTCLTPCRKAELVDQLGGGCWYMEET